MKKLIIAMIAGMAFSVVAIADDTHHEEAAPAADHAAETKADKKMEKKSKKTKKHDEKKHDEHATH